MEIKQVAAAGTLESSDCMIVIKPGDGEGIDISLESVVKTTFGVALCIHLRIIFYRIRSNKKILCRQLGKGQ